MFAIVRMVNDFAVTFFLDNVDAAHKSIAVTAASNSIKIDVCNLGIK